MVEKKKVSQAEFIAMVQAEVDPMGERGNVHVGRPPAGQNPIVIVTGSIVGGELVERARRVTERLALEYDIEFEDDPRP